MYDYIVIQCCYWLLQESWAISQRWLRDRPEIRMPENFRESLMTTPTATFPELFNVLLFRLSLWMYIQNLKFVALPVPRITGGMPKNWAVPGYAHAPFSSTFLMVFCSDGPFECIGQIWRIHISNLKFSIRLHKAWYIMGAQDSVFPLTFIIILTTVLITGPIVLNFD